MRAFKVEFLDGSGLEIFLGEESDFEIFFGGDFSHLIFRLSFLLLNPINHTENKHFNTN